MSGWAAGLADVDVWRGLRAERMTSEKGAKRVRKEGERERERELKKRNRTSTRKK
jgi:hypothetical protein